MRFQGALVKEQGVTFAIIIVKQAVIRDKRRAVGTAHSFGAFFGAVPIVLMAQDSRGTPSYWGRKDVVRFLSRISLSRIPWKEYTI